MPDKQAAATQKMKMLGRARYPPNRYKEDYAKTFGINLGLVIMRRIMWSEIPFSLVRREGFFL